MFVTKKKYKELEKEYREINKKYNQFQIENLKLKSEIESLNNKVSVLKEELEKSRSFNSEKFSDSLIGKIKPIAKDITDEVLVEPLKPKRTRKKKVEEN